MEEKVKEKFTSIGGQAVLEGVMMRSPNFIAVAVRKPDQKIAVKFYPYKPWSKTYPILAKPFLRGILMLVESMIQGMKALSYSAQASGQEEGQEELSKVAIIGSMAFAFVMGMLLFVALPHGLTALLTSDRFLAISADSPLFHLLDGIFKMFIFIGYIWLISRMNEIKRVFQYHGAEHKSIYAFEAGKPLEIGDAQKFTTLHPRCGTSFLLFLILISIVMFSVMLPLLGLTHFSDVAILNHLGMIVAKIILMFPVAGIAYEFIKVCAFRMDSKIFRALIWPGLMLQKLTTIEPANDQMEVALVSLRQVLFLEKTNATASGEIIVSGLSDVGGVSAAVTEFLEA